MERDVTAETDGETDPLTSVNQRKRNPPFYRVYDFQRVRSSFREQLLGTGNSETMKLRCLRSFALLRIELQAMKEKKEKEGKSEKGEKRKEAEKEGKERENSWILAERSAKEVPSEPKIEVR